MAVSRVQVLIVLFCVSVCQGQEGSPCPSQDWQLVGQSTCMMFVNRFQLTAGRAKAWCSNIGASLIRFVNYDSVRAFAQVAMSQSHDGWWSDLTDVDQPGVWTWGGTQTVTPGALGWATEPTDTHHVENCVTMDTDGYLSDEDCDRRLGFICSYSPAANTNCTGEFTAVNGQCYTFSQLDESEQLVSWGKASNSCAALSPQNGITPVLATFTTAAQLQGIQALARSTPGVGKRWVGLNDRATEGQWTWPDGSAMTDTSFLTSQWKTYPDRGSGHSCGLVHSDGQMEEADCEQRRHFACQISLPSDYMVLELGMGCPPPWVRAGTKCYLFNPGSWKSHQQARAFCTTHQGSLLKVDNLDERDWVIQQTISLEMYYMWTGLKRASDGSSTWVWDDGSPADPTLYQWDKQPYQGAMTTATCAFINTNGLYNSANCFTPMSFICETTTEDVPCPDRWMSDISSDVTRCYYVSVTATDGAASWRESLNRCKDMSGQAEAHLVAIDSQAELDYMVSLMISHPYAGYWTDLTSKQTQGVWQFSQQYEGSPPPIPWDNEPNNFGGHQNCAVMYVEGKYNDEDCNSTAQVACERPAAIFHSSSSSSTRSMRPVTQQGQTSRGQGQPIPGSTTATASVPHVPGAAVSPRPGVRHGLLGLWVFFFSRLPFLYS